MNRNFLIGLLVGIIVSLFVVSGYLFYNRQKLLSPSGVATLVPRPKPLLKYTYENLKTREYSPSEIKFEKIIASDSSHTVWQIAYISDANRVSGVVNLPINVSSSSAWTRPVILMIRGFADPKDYYPGFGTEHLAQYLVANGFVTIAPDFLGYGTSDKADEDDFANRFKTYTTTLNLISSIENNCTLLQARSSRGPQAPLIVHCSLGMWGHSNGGQIALSTLEISGKNIPTALWNPVSATFPYSILYYNDPFKDDGKNLRKSLSDFEADYDSAKFSPLNYLDWINGTIFIQQGGIDESVPVIWSDNLNQQLATSHKQLDYKIYPGNDHNMLPNWNQVAGDTLNFFKNELNQ